MIGKNVKLRLVGSLKKLDQIGRNRRNIGRVEITQKIIQADMKQLADSVQTPDFQRLFSALSPPERHDRTVQILRELFLGIPVFLPELSDPLPAGKKDYPLFFVLNLTHVTIIKNRIFNENKLKRQVGMSEYDV
jgi:hypothetical protein